MHGPRWVVFTTTQVTARSSEIPVDAEVADQSSSAIFCAAIRAPSVSTGR